MNILRCRLVKVLFFFLALCLTGCPQPQPGAGGKGGKGGKGGAAPAPEQQPVAPDAIKIVVSTPPQKYLVKRLAGEHAYVVSLLGEQDDFMAAEQLSDQQAAELDDAKLFFKIGAPFEKTLKVPASCRTYDMLKNVKLKPFSAHTKYLSGNKSFVSDPYIWMSPGQTVKMLTEVYQGLRAVGNEQHYGEFTQNFTRLTRELNSLEGDIQRILLDSLSRDIIVAKPVLGYFCGDFALKQFTYDFSQQNAAADFIRAAIENKIRVVLFAPFAPSGIDSRTADLLGGAVDTINPLAEDYKNNLLRIASSIAGRRYDAQ